jgi:hypothetical protein
MERPPRGPWRSRQVAVAALLTIVGWALFVLVGKLASSAAGDGSWLDAAIAFLATIVAFVAAFTGSYAFSHTSLRVPKGEERSLALKLRELECRRDGAYRRATDLRKYASFCELEARCWPEDSIDRAELEVYASVARRLADESLREWRELVRALRAERFEQITSKRSYPGPDWFGVRGHKPHNTSSTRSRPCRHPCQCGWG